MATKRQLVLKVTDCKDCPFSVEYDMASGFGCKVDTDDREIKAGHKNIPITPYWCKLKMNNVLITNE